MFGFFKRVKASHILILSIITILILIVILLHRTAEKFGTTPAAFIQMNARDNQDDRTISGLRVGADCGIRPTQRGYSKTGYLRF